MTKTKLEVAENVYNEWMYLLVQKEGDLDFETFRSLIITHEDGAKSQAKIVALKKQIEDIKKYIEIYQRIIDNEKANTKTDKN